MCLLVSPRTKVLNSHCGRAVVSAETVAFMPKRRIAPWIRACGKTRCARALSRSAAVPRHVERGERGGKLLDWRTKMPCVGVSYWPSKKRFLSTRFELAIDHHRSPKGLSDTHPVVRPQVVNLLAVHI
jgi:hypothetical protein